MNKDDESDVTKLRARIFKRDDEVREAISRAGIELNEGITLLALVEIVHTQMSQGIIVGERLQAIGKNIVEAVTKFEEPKMEKQEKKETVN